MAEMQPCDGSSTSTVCGGSSESTLQLNIKTLDSQIFSFHVDKNISVSAFKEKIAVQSGVPVGQQRLIFRGKVLKDDHLLAEYSVENGDTLHLVERQPQPPPGPSTGEATSNNGSRGQDSNIVFSRHRIGPIAHSIVLGTLNVGDPGEAVAPDISRVIGAVLNTIGIGNQTGGLQHGVPASHVNEAEGSQANAVGQNQVGNESVPWQAFHGLSAPHAMQIPLGASTAIPFLNTPIPDSLSTLREFMNRMEQSLSQNGVQTNQSTVSGGVPSPELPSNSRGLPTVEGLSIVLQHAQNLLSDHVVPAISRTAVHLNQDGGSNDHAVRRQVQTDSIQLGMAMQHLGALFLELGRTVLTLCMGQSPADSFVNAGPAVYISPSGPNPIMVQPFPLQSSSLFGGSSGASTNPVAMGPFSVPRNVNIHIHTGAALGPTASPAVSRAPNGEAEVNSQIRRSLIANMQRESHAPSDGLSNRDEHVGSGEGPGRPGNGAGQTSHVEDQQVQTAHHELECEPSVSSDGGSHKRSITSTHGNVSPDGPLDVPKGLGVGGLQPKRRGNQPRAQTKDGGGPSASSQNQQSLAVGQHILQSLASHSTRGNSSSLSPAPQPNVVRGVGGSVHAPRQNADGQSDITEAMSQILQGPALDGLLAGVSQQTGVGSPDMLRNMLQQFTQNPAMRNTVNQLAQQIDNHDLGSMFPGLDRGPAGGGIDLSRMMQQMMPIVSKALGGVSSEQTTPPESVLSDSRSRSGMMRIDDDPQDDLQQVVQRLVNQGSSEEIFRSLADRAVNLYSGSNAGENIINEVCSEEGLAQELMEMLYRDVSRKFHDDI
ncbi:hypothetical protein ACS0TY_013842 [Phlomoides rotata]